MFTGKIPFPTFIIYLFPAFKPIAPPDLNTHVANIGDLVSAFFPYHMLASSTWSDGFPLWNPYLLSGVPFIANPQSALFYAPNALYYLLPTTVAWSIGFLLRIFLAGFFTALLLRRIGGSTTGSLVAGLLFAFSGFITAWNGMAMSDAAIWLPLICYAVVRLHEDRSATSLVIAAGAFAMTVLAGHPETAAHLAVTGTSLAVFLALFHPDTGQARRPIQYLLLFCGAALLAAGLTGVQILPTAEWLPRISRSFDVPWPPAPLWAALGYVSRDVLRPVNSFGLQIPEHAAYIGMFAFVAFPLAWLHVRRRYVVFFTLSTIAAFCTAYDVGPLLDLSYRLPVIGGLKNHRLILVVLFGIAVLAGLGTTALERLRPDNHKLRIRAGMSVLVGFCLALLVIYAVRLHVQFVVEPSRFPRVSLLLLIVSAAAVVWRLLGGLQDSRFGGIAVLITAIDVCSFAYGFVPFDKPDRVFPKNEIFARLDPKTAEPFRLSQVGEPYIANMELAYGIPSSIGYDSPLKRTIQFITGAALDAGDAVELDAKLLLEAKDRRIDMLCTKYLAVSQENPLSQKFHDRPDRFKFLFTYGNTDVFENLQVVPPAILVPGNGILVESNERRQLELISSPTFDPLRSVVLSEPIAASRTPALQGKVMWISRRNSSFHVKVENPQDSILVVSQMFYPGWKARVDGKDVSVFPANFGLTAIAVNAGSHDIVFRFAPLSFKIGLIVSLLSVGITVGLLWFVRS